jgi:hypothetical protein
MPYSSFSLAQVERQFDLNVAEGAFFGDLPELAPRSRFKEFLQLSAPFAVAQSSVRMPPTVGFAPSYRGKIVTKLIQQPFIADDGKKVRSELIIAPLLFELRELLDRQIGFFSGMDFTIDIESGLSGVCDFILTRSSNQLIIEAPAIVLVEAKKGEINAGWGQCAAEMVAAQKFNLSMGKEISVIYGSVTTGMQWQFLRLSGADLTIDTTQYSLDPIEHILGILKWMVGDNLS